MKKLYYLIALSLFVSLSSIAQNKIFPDTFAIWREYGENMEDPGNQSIKEYSYLMQGDTQISNYTYKVVYNTLKIEKAFKNGNIAGPYDYNIHNNYGYSNRVGGIRKDGQKLIYLPFTVGASEIIAYDYTLQSGDTVIKAFDNDVKVRKDSLLKGKRVFYIEKLTVRHSADNFIIEGMGYNRMVLPVANTMLDMETVYVKFFCGDGVLYIGDPFSGGFSSTSSSLCKEELSAFLSVESAQTTQITIYPNPVSDVFTINGCVPNTQVIITDVSGKKIKEITVKDTWVNVDVSNLPNGVYFLNSISEKGTFTQKILKQ
jgi:hypothetical protein